MPRVLFRAVVVLALFASIGVLGYFARNSHAAAPADQAKHGLTGSFYVATRSVSTDTPAASPYPQLVQVWHDPNDFMLPRLFSGPAATRVDPQVAFGQGKGFNAKPAGPPMIWWPTGFALPGWPNPNAKPWDQVAAVIWKGYIHLPKPGTYYLATISNGGSAVYLNQARVALNGISGGVLVSDAFIYAKEDVQDFVQNLYQGRENVLTGTRPGDSYVVPVTIDAPRDLPIEVQYNPTQHFTHWASDPLGIDLFWVTPDSPRDGKGKPVAKIVPSEALYTEPPGPIEKSAVRSANSMVSADHLYFPTEFVEESVTITIRLADKDGNPVAGKRVYISSLASSGNSDAITQPEKPTDENGVTTAKIRAGEGYKVDHDSTIFATDMTDLVDVAQVAHVTFQQVDWNFFTDAFSPYYDPRFSVTPLPPVVGNPATIKTEIKNRSKFPAKVTVTFLTTDANIGFMNWDEIAKVKDIVLQPGESKQVETTFTPREVMGHKCYKVEVEGRYIAMHSSGGNVFAAALVPATMVQNTAPANPSNQTAKYGQQINTQTVAPEAPPPECGPFDNGDYKPFAWPGMDPPPRVGDLQKQVDDLRQRWQDAVSPEERKRLGDDYAKAAGALKCVQYIASGKDIPWEKEQARKRLPDDIATTDFAWHEWLECINHPQSGLDPLWCQTCEKFYKESSAQLESDRMLANDPPNPNYRRLAVAASDTPAAYIDAVRVSLERFRSAEAEGDSMWMARHFTARQLYGKRLAESLRRDAAGLEETANRLAPTDQQRVAQSQANWDQFMDALRQRQKLPDDDVQRLKAAGISDAYIKSFEQDLLQQKEPVKIKAPKDFLLDAAARNRSAAESWEKAAGSVSETADRPDQSHGPLSQTYTVANPHDRQENVDLFIRPISIPPDWKLSVVNAGEPAAQGQKTPGNGPQYPVREVDAGKHYAVTLPAQGQVKVESVLVPVGGLGAHTTARWAVEGKIGNELIGGMVHGMNVPYIIADLQLPPVGSKEVEGEVPVPSKAWTRIATEVSAGILILAVLVYLFFWRRRRGTGSSATP